VRRADNVTTFVCRLSRDSGSLNPLEPGGPVQAWKEFDVCDVMTSCLFSFLADIFVAVLSCHISFLQEF
jgi:hypothetical protein